MALFGNRETDAQVVLGVGMDVDGLKRSLDSLTSTIEAAASKWDEKIKGSSDDMKSAMNSAFDVNRVKNWAIQAGKAIGTFIADSINLASDLEEVQNVVDVTFGDDADQIDTWAKNARTQFGLTEKQAKQFASTMGAMLKSGGITDDNMLVKMSTDLAGLAADMASFYNLDFDEAFQKIQSGITGITQPLKSLGINMSESNLTAFAEANGQLYSAMSEAEKMVLRYQYLMSVTADAQGDFARTSDGFANQMRLVQTNLDALKTSIGTALLPIVNEALKAVNDLISAFTTQMPDTVLDTFADIDADTERKMATIQVTADSARMLLGYLKELGQTTVNTENGEVTYEKLFQKMAELTAAGGDVEGYLASLGLTVDDVSKDYANWLTLTDRLTDTMPSLSTIINDQTGAIEGGTQAVSDYIDEWERLERNNLIKQAASRKVDAYESAKANLYGYWLDAAIARQMQQNAEENLRDKMGAAGAANGDMDLRTWANAYVEKNWERYAGHMFTKPMTDAERSLYEAAQAYVGGAYEENAAKAERIYEEQAAALEQVKDEYEVMAGIVSQLDDNTDGLADTMSVLERRVESGELSLDDLKQTLENLTPALERINEIIKETAEESEKEIASVVSGFGQIETPAEKARAQVKSLEKQITEANSTELNIKIADLNNSIPTMSNMIAGLNDQIAYMEQYSEMLMTAQAMGVDAGLLATLANGDTESYDYLKAILDDPKKIEELNAAWRDLQTQKGITSGNMTDVKLAANTEFQGLVAEVETAIDEIDMADGARDAMYDTVEGMVAGISAAFPDLRKAIGEIMEQLNVLNSYGVLGFYNGSLSTDFSGGLLNPDGSAAVGMDYVPFDNFLAQLHEGEAVLPAEEARVWRDFRYGAAAASNSIDYDALGSTFKENAGGNVYLDGRIVGNVISSRQADSYRGLERSGWRG